MKCIAIACIVSTIGCGPAFTVAPEETSSIVTDDVGDAGTVTDAGALERDSSSMADVAAKLDAEQFAEHDAGHDMGTVGKSDAAQEIDASEVDTGVPDVASPPADAGTPSCVTVYSIAACDAWAAVNCAGPGEAMCCRDNGICGCKITSTAACL